MRNLLCGFLLFCIGCGVPSSLKTPEGQRAYRANEVVQRLGEFQQAVIDAERANKINTADARSIVTWISGDANATPPVTGAIDVLTQAPNGWRSTVNAGWATIRPRVQANPTLSSWVAIIDSLLATVVGALSPCSIHTVTTGRLMTCPATGVL